MVSGYASITLPDFVQLSLPIMGFGILETLEDDLHSNYKKVWNAWKRDTHIDHSFALDRRRLVMLTFLRV